MSEKSNCAGALALTVVMLSIGSATAETIHLTTAKASCDISTDGAKVLSWKVGGEEQLWQPKEWRKPETKWLHGGIPICWPIFGSVPGGKAPPHGTAWKTPFEVKAKTLGADKSTLTLGLCEGGLELVYRLELTDRLNIAITTVNRSGEGKKVSVGLHPYFRLRETAKARVIGTDSLYYRDARDGHTEKGTWKGDIVFNDSYDHVFTFAKGKFDVKLADGDGGRRVKIVSPNAERLVVWNPGANDMGGGDWVVNLDTKDDWRHFACVEPVSRDRSEIPVLAPGATLEFSAEFSIEEPAAKKPEDFVRMKYNHPGLSVDLGIGIWGRAEPYDYDGDGYKDIVLRSFSVPSQWTLFYKNPGTAIDAMPIFPKGVMVEEQAIKRNPGDEQLPNLPKVAPDDASQSRSFAARDLDGDGRKDLICVVSDNRPYGGNPGPRCKIDYHADGSWAKGLVELRLYWYRNEGGKGRKIVWSPPQEIPVGDAGNVMRGPCGGHYNSMASDWDGDGDIDIIIGEFVDTFWYFENVGGVKTPRFANGRPVVDERGKPLTVDLCMFKARMVDWDGDGLTDIIAADEDTRTAFYRNLGRTDAAHTPIFAAGRYFRQEAEYLKFGCLGVPYAIDWDGDGDLDFICGNSAGYIGFIENLSGKGAEFPKWAEPKLMTANGKTIRTVAGKTGSPQGPAEAKWGYSGVTVGDWDGDGILDIMANDINGDVLVYRGKSAKGGIDLNAAEHVEVEWEGRQPQPPWEWRGDPGKALRAPWRTTAEMIDWDGDGLTDLVCSDHEGYLCLYARAIRDGKRIVLPPKRVFCDHVGRPLRLNPRTEGSSGRRRFCFLDWDGDGRRDMIWNAENGVFYQQIAATNGTWRFRYRGGVAAQKLAGHACAPCRVDFNDDGVDDLVINAEDGLFYYLRNARVFHPSYGNPYDERPGEVVPMKRERFARPGRFWLYAAKPEEKMKFTLQRVSLKPGSVIDNKAPQLQLRNELGEHRRRWYEPTRKPSDYEYVAPAPGFYSLDFDPGEGNAIVPISANVPFAIEQGGTTRNLTDGKGWEVALRPLHELRSAAAKVKVDQPLNLLWLGDSLTDYDRGSNHVDIVARYLEQAHPGKVRCWNYAKGGDCIRYIINRMDGKGKGEWLARYADLWSRQYDWAFVFLGHNDTKTNLKEDFREPYTPRRQQHELYDELIRRLRAHGVKRIILMSSTSSNYEVCSYWTDHRLEKARQEGKGLSRFGEPVQLEAFNAALREIAARNQVEYLDLYEKMKSLAHKARMVRGSDGVHLTQRGHDYVALETLKYLEKPDLILR